MLAGLQQQEDALAAMFAGDAAGVGSPFAYTYVCPAALVTAAG